MDDAPLCPCHSVLMLWNKDSRYRAGGYWKCRIRKSESQMRRYAESPEVRLNQQLRNLSRVRISY